MALLGRPYAHSVDVFIRNIALVALLILGGALIYDATKEHTSPKTGESSATCWVPAEFANSHTAYAQEYCKVMDKKYVINRNSSIPGRTQHTKIKFDLNDRKTPKSQLPNMQAFIGDFYMHKVGSQVMMWIVTHAAVTCVIFLLLRNIAGRAYSQAHVLLTGQRQQAAKTLLTSRCTAISYMLVQVSQFLAIVIIFDKLYNLWPEESNGVEENSSPKVTNQVFLCDFAVRQMGKLQPFTLQCIGRQVAEVLPNTSAVPHLILYLHTALAGIHALMNLFHILQVHVLTPATTHVMTSYGNAEIKSFPQKLLFGFSDLNLALLFVNSMGSSQVIMPVNNSQDALFNQDPDMQDPEKKAMEVV